MSLKFINRIPAFITLLALAALSYSQVPTIERDALIAFYISTNGAKWSDDTGWLGVPGTECNWKGIKCTERSSAQVGLELLELRSVMDLDLSKNALTGVLPSELGNLVSLSYLQLRANILRGSIPKELGKLTKLTSIDLSGNILSGGIPLELGNLINLTYLNLADNSLSGSIPVEVSSLPQLINTHYFGNTLVGVKVAMSTAAQYPYTPTAEWPTPYFGVTPDSKLGLVFNNIGFFSPGDAAIYSCTRLSADGLASSANGISQFDIGLKVVSLADATVQITKSREFNAIGALNEEAQFPDCSGIFETTTGLYTDIIQVNTSVFETVWHLIDSTKLILKLLSSKELTAN